jgi:L-lactate dehydrogenase complex protein LldG
MSSREAILRAVRENQPRPAVPLPEITEFARDEEPLVARFRRMLEVMGGRCFEVADADRANAMIRELFPDAKIVCSAVPEVPGTRRVEEVREPHELHDVDVGVVRTPLAVAELGAVWLTQDELVVNALGVLPEHLIILLDPAAIVATIHDAYRAIDLARSPYGVFLAGPSATGDIEGVIIRGAQGARSLAVLLLALQGTPHRAFAGSVQPKGSPC